MSSVNRPTAVFTLVGTLFAGVLSVCSGQAPGVPAVEPVDLSAVPLASFTDEDLDVTATFSRTVHPMPYYLAHLAALANSIRLEPPDRGFLDLRVWRSRREFQDQSPRIMENVLSLAYFYTAKRPWNVYRGDPALRQRLELALAHLLSLQEDSGRMRPSSPDERPTMTLGITMFFTKFTGQTLALLAGEPGIDAELYERAMAAQRHALLFLLRSDAAFEQGRRYSNQYGNVWAGAYAYLRLRPDAALRQAVEATVRRSRGQFQSPAGFPYENHATDFQYSLGTHHSNLDMAWYYARQLDWADVDWLVEDARLWADWLSYNAVPEPSWEFFCLNRAIETRQDHAGFGRVEVAIAEAAPALRAFAVSQEEAELRQRRIRESLAEDWPEVSPLKVPQYRSYTPYAFLHRDHVTWRPTDSQRREARRDLPCMRAESFAHQRVDSRRPFAATFVRRPGYYAVFNGGTQRNRVQIFGLGLLWHPSAGTVVQSQTRLHGAAWGIRAEDSERVEETLRPVAAEYRIDKRPIQPLPGARDLPRGDLVIRYPLDGSGWKAVRFDQDRLVVEMTWDRPFVEQIPLLLPEATEVEVADGRVRVAHADWTLQIDCSDGTIGMVQETSRQVHRKTTSTVVLRADKTLTYSLQILPAP